MNKLERTGLITADVDLFVTYEGDVRQILIRVQVTEVAGCMVIHKDLLTAQITLPQRHHGHHGDDNHGQQHRPQSQVSNCASSDLMCRFDSWVNSLMPSCGQDRPHRSDGERHRGESHHHPGEYHRHRLNRPRRGFMKFIISVVVPVLIGAAAGVGIGIISVFIAEIVGGIIMRIRGRRNMEYVEIDRKDDDDDDEELPVYEELEATSTYTEEKQ